MAAGSSSARHRLEYWAACVVLATLARTPFRFAFLLARGYVQLLDWAVPRLRRTAYRNLSFALPGADRVAVTDGVFRSIARMLVVFARFPLIHRDNVSSWIRYEGFEHFQAAMNRGKGVLFATAHLGNWELSAYAHGLLTAPMHVVVRPLDNPLIDSLVEHRRGLSGNTLIGKREAVRSILRTLGANQAVGVLVDQNVQDEEGLFVDFFGVPASTSGTFARIAHRTGAAVIPGFALWSEKEGKYILHFYPPVEMTGNVNTDSAAIQQKIEEVIRLNPDQWVWLHRRWKTRPPSELPVY